MNTQSLRITLSARHAIQHITAGLGVHSDGSSQWMPLAQLRADLADYTRDEIDTALTDLMRTRTIRVMPQEVQHRLTPADRAAALWLGGEYKHFIARP